MGVVEEATHRGVTAEDRLLAIFDVFGDWFVREDFEMKGSIISAAEGDVHAGRRARTMAQWLIEHHRAGTGPRGARP